MAPANESAKADTPSTPAPVESQKETPTPEAQAELSRKAAQMGDSRKAAFSTLVKLAKSNDAAKSELMALAKDEYNRAYLEEKFGDDFKTMVDVPKVESNPALENLQKTVDRISKDQKIQRENKVASVKAQLGLTLDQVKAFEDLVDTFEGAKIDGQELSHDEALIKAAAMMKPTKSVSLSSGRSDTKERPEDETSGVKIPISQARVDKNSFYTGAKSPDDFKPYVESFATRGSHKLSVNFK